MAQDRKPHLLSQPSEGVPSVIDTLTDFQRMCQKFSIATGSLAADAERASGFRYGHQDYLVQFKRDGAGIALVDPVAIGRQGGSWEDFNKAVESATWIIHDSKQDLPGFTELGLRPNFLFDTELAARMLGLSRVSLAAVTEHYLGLSLAKEHSAVDWSYRPLPRDWRNYAALDVELLIDLEKVMTEDLCRQGKEIWAKQEFEWLLRTDQKNKTSTSEPWRHTSHITVLRNDRRGLAIVRALWFKRDELARTYDISPSLLLSDSAIIEAATRKPHNGKQFRSIRSLNERIRVHTGSQQDKMFERYAPIQRSVRPNVWRETIYDALALCDEDLPNLSHAQQDENESGTGPKSLKIWKRHPERFQRLLAVRETVQSIAQEVSMPSDVLIKPQYLRDLCWTDEPLERDVAEFLTQEGARPWQVDLVSESVSRVMM